MNLINVLSVAILEAESVIDKMLNCNDPDKFKKIAMRAVRDIQRTLDKTKIERRKETE